MRRILTIHIILLLTAIGAFFTLGWIDKTRFDKASLSYEPELLFSYSKCLIRDGGSIYWDSLIYNAHESRRMRVWQEGGETQVADGFQGTSWTWKYHNVVWISLIIGSSFIGSFVTFRKIRHVEPASPSSTEP